jgi:hypothetical protein
VTIVNLDRLVPYEGTDFLVQPYDEPGPLLPGDHFTLPYTDIRVRFDRISADPDHRWRGRIQVTDESTDTTHTLSPAKAGLSIHAVVNGVHDSTRPRGGDAIRLAAPWAWGYEVAVGEIGVLGGHIDRDSDGGSVTMRASTHRCRRDGWVSCSGGPATIHTDPTELQPTTDITVLRVWDWGKNLSGAGNGVDYIVKVRVWDWFPTD